MIYASYSKQGCQSVPPKKPETDGKNLKKRVNLNQNSQKWAENKKKTRKFGLTKNLNSGKNLKTGIPEASKLSKELKKASKLR